jgi:hypothetical protein
MTAAYAGFAGLKNGTLLKSRSDAKFEVLVTGYRTLQFEQNLRKEGGQSFFWGRIARHSAY